MTLVDAGRSDKTVSEADLRLLYDAYHGLKVVYPDILPSYAAFLRKLRAKLHPIGVVDYRAVVFDARLFFDVDLGDRLGCDFYYGLYSEYADSLLFNMMINPDSIILDVGANFGFYSVFAASKRGFDGVVHAFEPNGEIFTTLRHNVVANSLCSKVFLHECAIGDRKEIVDFLLAEESSFSGVFDTKRSNIRATRRVGMTTIDLFVKDARLGKVDLIKIDVEGLESGVLRGAREIVRDNDICVQLEVSKKNLDEMRLADLKMELQRLQEIGFVGRYFDQVANRFVRQEELCGLAGSEPEGNVFLVRRGSDIEKKLELHASDILATGMETGRIPVCVFDNKRPARARGSKGMFVDISRKHTAGIVARTLSAISKSFAGKIC